MSAQRFQCLVNYVYLISDLNLALVLPTSPRPHQKLICFNTSLLNDNRDECITTHLFGWLTKTTESQVHVMSFFQSKYSSCSPSIFNSYSIKYTIWQPLHSHLLNYMRPKTAIRLFGFFHCCGAFQIIETTDRIRYESANIRVVRNKLTKHTTSIRVHYFAEHVLN